MLTPDRHRLLLVHLAQHGSARVEELSDELGVSASTVRRDLVTLHAQGRLVRARGGAYAAVPEAAPPRPVESTATAAAKDRIGQAAAARVADGATIMVLAGTTTAAMLPHLALRTVTVVTNGLAVATQLASSPTVTVVMLGGILHRQQMTFIGPMTEQGMADLHVDAIYAGAWGVDADIGVTGDKVIQAGYHHGMLKHARSLTVLADATKFGRRGSAVLAAIDQVDTFITDHDAPQTVLTALRQRGAQIVSC